MARVFVNMFWAALEPRYAYQPPSRLSPMLPTRAEMLANTARSACASSVLEVPGYQQRAGCVDGEAGREGIGLDVGEPLFRHDAGWAGRAASPRS